MAKNQSKSLIRLRGDTYYENFTYDGVRYRGSLHTSDEALAKAMATARLDKLQRAKYLGINPEDDKRPTEMTLDGAFGKYWLDYAQDLPSANKIEVFFVVLRVGLGGDTLLSAITPTMLNDYATQRRLGQITHREDSWRKGVRLANSTVNNELLCLQTVMNRARKKWGVRVAEIDWKDVLLEDEGERQHILTRRANEVATHPLSNQPDEETRLFDALRDDVHAFTRFMLIGGLRLSNVVYLTWEQVQWAECRIEFRLKSKKKHGKLHYLPITDSIRAKLMGELGRHPTRVFTYVCRKTDDQLKHVKGQRYPVTKSGFQALWKRARNDAGLFYGEKDPRNLRIHDLRHTAATRALTKAGGNIKTVQKFLGHSKITTTARYLKTEVSDVAAAMD
jgi:integrase